MVGPTGQIPDDPLGFIQECVRNRRILWTYHVNMRLEGRFIARDDIIRAVESFQIIEAYPEDKYLPSFLLLAKGEESAFHVLIAVDLEGDNVRIVTAYRPGQEHWMPDLVTRRKGR
jgi:hypothetical protein